MVAARDFDEKHEEFRAWTDRLRAAAMAYDHLAIRSWGAELAEAVRTTSRPCRNCCTGWTR